MMHLFIDDADLNAVIEQFPELPPKAVPLAFHRAMRRTEQTIISQASRLLKGELKLSAQKALKARVKTYIRPSSSNMEEMKFWFGMNDLPPNVFSGKPRKTKGGLMFRGHYYDRAFVTIRNGKTTYRQRDGAARTPTTKITIPIPDDIVVKIEDEVLEQMPEIFMRHFATDLQGRSKSNGWQNYFAAGGHGSIGGMGQRIMNTKKIPRGASNL